VARAAQAGAPGPARLEAALAARWADGFGGALRLQDGRPLHVIFPGVAGGGAGPDFTGAILDAGGDYLRGDVEIHLLASGWRAHGHESDPAYAGVVLHVVGANDGGPLTAHTSGRLIPVLVAPPEAAGFPPPFAPPCSLRAARGEMAGPALDRLGLRRLRIKAARVEPEVRSAGAGQALYRGLLEVLGGPANRVPFGAIARELPLAYLLEEADANAAGRALTISALLKGRAAVQVLRRAGLRPMAAPGRRLEAAGELLARLWPANSGPCWPARLEPDCDWRTCAVPGIGRSLALECLANAVLPVALAGGAWPAAEVERAWLALPSPGTYGRLKRLEGWLVAGGVKPFAGAARLQGGLLLHADYCTRGMCGRCPLSE